MDPTLTHYVKLIKLGHDFELERNSIQSKSKANK